MKGLLIIALVALFVACAECDNNIPDPEEPCPTHSCIEASKCPGRKLSQKCALRGDVCCSKIKEQNKHRCNHFLAECLSGCNPRLLKKQADDCPAGRVCCVLV